MTKILLAFISSCLFVFLLLCTYWVHTTYFKVEVVLYSAIMDGILATLASVILLMHWQRLNIFNNFEKLQIVIIWLLTACLFAITIPTVLDRSLSFYILEKIQQRGGGIQLEKFEEIFAKEYLKEHRLIDVRLTEQLESKTILIQDGCVKLTARGEALVVFSRFFRLNFLPKQRLLMGTYSDDMTDPFRNSDDISSYKCR